MRKIASLVVVLLLAMTMVAVAGGRQEAPVGIVEGPEPPFLASLVEAGELPPLADRLPDDFQVVQPVESIGRYGGTLRSVDIAGVEIAGLVKHGLFALAQDFETGEHDYYGGIAEEKFVPDLARDGEFSNNFQTFTLYLRRGMRWSDGTPATADDFMFWWEDIINNEDIVADVPTVWRPGGEPMGVSKIDDYTIEFTFAEPYRFFKYYLGDLAVRQMPLRPRHYLEQFHIDYNPNATALAVEAGFDEWYELFVDMGGGVEPQYHQLDGMPTLFPWVTVEYRPEIWVGERNPYYFRVDPEGKQLPYIDRVVVEISTNVEVQTGKAVAGQVDYSAVALSFTDIPLLRESEAAGGFTAHLWDVPMGAMPSILINQAYPEDRDPVLREIFQDVRFRRALSMAIDREEANRVAYFGVSYPTQATVLPGSRWDSPEVRNAWAEYDVAAANALLDDMGLRWDSNRQWRLRPDGERLSVVIETIDVGAIRGYSRIMPLIKEYWDAIGVQTILNQIEPGLFGPRLTASELQVTMWGIDTFNDLSFQILGPWIIPGTSYGGTTWHAFPWHQWVVSDGRQGEEPPPEVMRMRELWLEMNRSNDQAEITRLGKEIFAIQAEYIHVIGVVGAVAQPIVVKNNLRNFPEGVWANDVSLAGYGWAFQWYFD